MDNASPVGQWVGVDLHARRSVICRMGLLSVQLTAVVTVHAAWAWSFGAKASSNSAGVSLPRPRWRRRWL